MIGYPMGQYDVIVIGAGHAGCEAGLASARMGKRTLVLSMTLEAVAMMACNPSIGGSGKGHLVREIDALGGQMGLAIDQTFLQSKMLNTSKGPAVHSLRAQADKHSYHLYMKGVLEKQKNLDLRQGEVVEILQEESRVAGVVLTTGATYRCSAVIVATGTFLGGRIFIGDANYEGGPNGMAPSLCLVESLRELGLSLRRFKTGTPARALGSSLHYERMKEQPGDPVIVPFSFMNETLEKDQVSCWLSYTNEKTHTVIRDNLGRSALFGGQIEGVGPRYCPSIEDKVNRFPDRERHQLFVEPEGANTDEVYIQGMSSSFPEDIQEAFYKTIEGLEDIRIVRPAYAIEYDCIDPLELYPWLEHKKVENLFCAGQFNGSSGYEEAAAQGLIAGVNAALKLDKREPFVLDRSEAYIGVLIDDLVTKGTNEPYRIMTSRAEYRLVLRQDNAEQRLTERARSVGLVDDDRFEGYLQRKRETEEEIHRLKNTWVTPSEAASFLSDCGSAPIFSGITLADLMKRSEITYQGLVAIDTTRPQISRHSATAVEVQIKYEGYIVKQQQQIDRFKKLEHRRLPDDIDYVKIEGLRIEARQKLSAVRPLSLGQASRISGVSPADISVLLIHLERKGRGQKTNGPA
ncbi:MAG: tRNA uridine-5-carboxymethylaminomethyl(34) synthesis enzyme MnmG [Firmicutes bacterium HGW-Firmicutes-11]|nr:MAG: tRNA uridine-5-carboxymethylaminomethyl(34) synthesis enzyme MnmG [Firmicutes bacterium HGW-Firmicutes-11]